ELAQLGLVLLVRRKPGLVRERVMPFQQSEPFSHQLLFAFHRCFLFEEDRADRGIRNGWVLLPEKVERLLVEIFKSAGIELVRRVRWRRNALAYARAI